MSIVKNKRSTLHTYLQEVELHDLHITRCLTRSSIISPATYLSFNQLFTFHLSRQPLVLSLSLSHICILQISTLTSCLNRTVMLSLCPLCFSSYLYVSAHALTREGNYFSKQITNVEIQGVSVIVIWFVITRRAYSIQADNCNLKELIKKVTGYMHRYTSHEQKQRQK